MDDYDVELEDEALMHASINLELLRELEWCGTSRGQGTGFMGSGGDGYPARSCPICGGIDPSDERGTWEFVKGAIGHRDDCRLAATLKQETV